MGVQGDRLREACGQPVSGEHLTREELELAIREHRALVVFVTSSMGDHQAWFTAVDPGQGKPVDAAGEQLVVYPKPIPVPLRGQGSGLSEQPAKQWEDGSEVLAALGAGELLEPLPVPTPAHPLPQEQLARIAAEPDADEPRLVAADLLLSAGEPRGDLIQLQCKRARATRSMDRLQVGRIDASIARLLNEHLERWRAEHGLAGRPFTLRRGFFEATAASKGSGGLKGLATVLERSPIVELEVRGETLAELLDHPVLAQLHTLTVDRTPLTAAQLARIPTARLRTLKLRQTPEPLSLEQVEAIASSPIARVLTELELPWVAEGALAALSRAPFPKLRDLVVPATAPEHVEALQLRFGKAWRPDRR